MLLPHRLRGIRFYELAPALFLLFYPVVAIVVHGGASRMTVVAALVAIVTWVRHREASDTGKWDGLDRCLLMVMAAPALSIFLAEVFRGDLSLKPLDTPLRFLIVFPLFLLLRRAPTTLLAWSDISFALGGLGACAITILAPGNWGGGRPGSYFLNPIHFGDIALVLGILSALSIDWWKGDGAVRRLVKLAGCMAGCMASALSGSRGGWVAVPMIALLILFMPRVGTLPVWKRLLFPITLCAIVAVALTTETIQQRFDALASDYQAYVSGDKDTSTGIRLQLYEAGAMLAASSPLLGLGPNGFHDAMQPLAERGVLTPAAAESGRGETHNQILLFAVDFGVLAAVALLAIHLAPCVLFWRALRTGEAYRRRAGLMGVVLTLSFFVFGMTVEIFNLKSTVSFYTTVLAILLAIALHKPQKQHSSTGGVANNV